MTEDPDMTEEVPLVLAKQRARRAYVCPAKDCLPPRRVFLFPTDPDEVPRCRDHARMVLQPNHPYRPPTETTG